MLHGIQTWCACNLTNFFILILAGCVLIFGLFKAIFPKIKTFWPQEPFKDSKKLGGQGSAGSYLESKIGVNTFFAMHLDALERSSSSLLQLQSLQFYKLFFVVFNARL